MTICAGRKVTAGAGEILGYTTTLRFGVRDAARRRNRTRRRRREGEAAGASRREGARHGRLRAGMRGRTRVRETVRSGVAPIGERTSAACVESRSAAER
jgi:hypothetical protein